MLYWLSKILTPINRPSALAVFLFVNTAMSWDRAVRDPTGASPRPGGLCGPALLTPPGGTALRPGSPASPVLPWGEKQKDDWGSGW